MINVDRPCGPNVAFGHPSTFSWDFEEERGERGERRERRERREERGEVLITGYGVPMLRTPYILYVYVYISRISRNIANKEARDPVFFS